MSSEIALEKGDNKVGISDNSFPPLCDGCISHLLTNGPIKAERKKRKGGTDQQHQSDSIYFSTHFTHNWSCQPD